MVVSCLSRIPRAVVATLCIYVHTSCVLTGILMLVALQTPAYMVGIANLAILLVWAVWPKGVYRIDGTSTISPVSFLPARVYLTVHGFATL